MAKKPRNDPKAQKAKRQKLFIAIGGVILLVLLVIQVPRTMKLLESPEEAAPAPAATTPGAVTTTPDGTAVPASEPAGGEADLPERDVQPQASDGQLVSFELFTGKDPFVQQVGVPTEGEGAAPKDDAEEAPKKGDGKPDADAPPPSSAVVSVNGVEETVAVEGEFPASDPSFVLVSVARASVKIGIAGGSLASGAQTVTLRLGKTLTLVNTADGTEYRIKLVSLA
jgi:hypothetical protein